MENKYIEDKIIDLINNSKKPLRLNTILDKLKISRNYKPKVKRFLRELIRDGIIDKYKNTYISKKIKTENIITGIVDLKKDFGFLLTENREDIFLNKSTIENLLPGDEIEVYVKESSRGSREGILKKIIKRTQEPIVCKIIKYGICFAVPINRESPFIKIKEEDDKIKEGDIVLLKVIESDKKLYGYIISKLYDIDDVNQYKKFILDKYEIRQTFPSEVLKEAEDLNINYEEILQRTDLRKENVITIDPADAKDFDDAVSLTKKDGFYFLGVHIADVSYFVREGTLLDKEALKRSFSTYLPGEVFPMLPQRLSSDICSLRENVDRLTFSIFIKFDNDGEMISYEIKETVIKNKRRFTYEEVEDILNNKKEIKNTEIKNMLFLMNELKEKLKIKFHKKGNIDFNLKEPIFIFNDKKLVDIKRKETLESHKIIEYFMISANICAADFILKNYKYGIFRVHPKPFKSDIYEFNTFLKAIGFGSKIKKGTNKEFQKILMKASGSKLQYLIEKNLLKTMSLARYSEKNTGHFGLGLEKYTHFTSPIRRYADLIVHRIIKNSIGLQKSNLQSKENLKTLSRHISYREEKTENAENEICKIYMLDFMKNKIGDKFCATIIKIVKNGIIAELNEYPVEGFISFDTINDDYYIYDSDRMIAIGKKTKKIFKLGDNISVIIMRIDMHSQRLLLEIEK